jgi:galactokinase
MRTLAVDPVALDLGGWRLVTVDSGVVHAHAGSGYNARRRECAEAAAALGVASLRDAAPDAAARLPDPLDRRVRHVLAENARVEEAVAALGAGDLAAVGALLDASHASLRDDYEVSVPEADRTVERLRAAGAAGARMVGGGFGGAVLGLFPPGASPPPAAVEVAPGPAARLLDP